MKNILITLSLILLMGLSYGQIVNVEVTLLRINGVAVGKIVSPDVEILPIAWETHLITTDTLDWTTVPIDSLQFQNTQLQNQVNLLQSQMTNITEQLNATLPRYEFNQLLDKLTTQPVLCEPE